MKMNPGCEYLLAAYIRKARQLSGKQIGDCNADSIKLLGRVISWLKMSDPDKPIEVLPDGRLVPASVDEGPFVPADNFVPPTPERRFIARVFGGGGPQSQREWRLPEGATSAVVSVIPGGGYGEEVAPKTHQQEPE